jgi:RNA-binding protein YlmH
MDSVEVSTFLSKRENAKITKLVSKEKVQEFIKGLDKEMDFEILPLIKNLISKEANSFSLSKQNPIRYIFISNGSNNLSISIRAFGRQTKVLIPKAAFEI